MRKAATCCTLAYEGHVLYLMTVHQTPAIFKQTAVAFPYIQKQKQPPLQFYFSVSVTRSESQRVPSSDTSQPTQQIPLYRAHPPNPAQKEKCSQSLPERQCANIFTCIPKYSKLPAPGAAYQVPRKGHRDSTQSNSVRPRVQLQAAPLPLSIFKAGAHCNFFLQKKSL